MRPFGATLLAAAIVCGGAIGALAFARRTAPLPERRVTFRPVQQPDDGYVSSDACRACHPSQYDTWHASYHRTMTQVAAPETIHADFDGTTVAAGSTHVMRLARGVSGFAAEFDDPDAGGGQEDAPRITRPIAMVTGSHYQQVYWYRTGRGRLVGQLPDMYLLADRRWIPRRAAFLRPPDGRAASETGRWNAVCIDCHATRGRPGFDAPVDSRTVAAQHPDTRAAEFGIACEACHGPGAAHASENRNPLRRYRLHLTGAADSTAVQPQRLDRRIASDVCGQCHSVWTFSSPAAKARAAADGSAYRPGEDLTKTRFIAQPSIQRDNATLAAIVAQYPGFLRDSFWSDGMIRVSGREYNGLIDSPCFRNAADERRRLTCFSCHTMHKATADPRSAAEWADTHQLGARMDSNEACLQCHAKIRADVVAHTKHRIDSTGSNCYNCHMPYTTYGLLRALRSHQISNPSVAATVQTGRPNACNLCHLDKTLAWTADRLQTMYGITSPALDEDQRTVAASVLRLLSGDAGQRALVAWSLGWKPAQDTSGTGWMPPYLALLLDDPYDAVRYIAYRSLRSVAGYEGLPYDFMAASPQRAEVGVGIMQRWQRARSIQATPAALLFDRTGALRQDEWTRLVRLRDDRPVSLAE